MYLDSSQTPLEVIVSSQNLSDYFDRQQYQDSVKDKITSTMATVQKLEATLEEEQKQQASVLASDNTSKQELAGEEAQQATLLAQTQGQEAAYQNIVAANQAQIGQLRAAQAAMWARIQAGSSGNGGTVGTFTYRNWTGNQGACGVNLIYCQYAQDSVVDPWRMYNRECVSYAAWSMANDGVPNSAMSGLGNAQDWPGGAAARGYRVDNNPDGNAVVMIIPSSMIGGVGHATVVESVSAGWVHVSQYNWGENGQYSEMDVKLVPGLEFIHFG